MKQRRSGKGTRQGMDELPRKWQTTNSLWNHPLFLFDTLGALQNLDTVWTDNPTVWIKAMEHHGISFKVDCWPKWKSFIGVPQEIQWRVWSALQRILHAYWETCKEITRQFLVKQIDAFQSFRRLCLSFNHNLKISLSKYCCLRKTKLWYYIT